jgi:hypothetical protein
VVASFSGRIPKSPAYQANVVPNTVVLTAAGTTQADAALITADQALVAAGADNSGLRLPVPMKPGHRIRIVLVVAAANLTIKLWPHSGGKCAPGLAANASFSLKTPSLAPSYYDVTATDYFNWSVQALPTGAYNDAFPMTVVHPITFNGQISAGGGIDVNALTSLQTATFGGATGVNKIIFPASLAAAFSLGVSGTPYQTFNSSLGQVDFNKPISGGISPAAKILAVQLFRGM